MKIELSLRSKKKKLSYRLLTIWVPKMLNPIMGHPLCKNIGKQGFKRAEVSLRKKERSLQNESKSEGSNLEGGGE